jgi:flagellar motility protein MotE (MotC chaperone)
MADLCAALAARFCEPEWAIFFEVSNATGYGRNRSADALAMNLWPSRGMEIHGVEVKTHRSDWLREMRDPAKSSPIQRFCDRWWLAIDDEKIVQPGELPPTWGLLELKGAKLVVKVEAPKLEAEALTRTFVASILRRSSDQRAAESRARFDARVDDRIAQLEKELDAERKKLGERMNQLIAKVDEERARYNEFLAACGLERESWRPSKMLGQAVGALLTGTDAARAELRRLRAAHEASYQTTTFLADIGQRLEQSLAALEDQKPTEMVPHA